MCSIYPRYLDRQTRDNDEDPNHTLQKAVVEPGQHCYYSARTILDASTGTRLVQIKTGIVRRKYPNILGKYSICKHNIS